MSRITKAIASDVARQLVSKHYEELKSLQSERAKFITQIYEKSIPEQVLKCFKTNRSYIQYQKYIRISGAGFQTYNSYELSKEMPHNGNYLEVNETDGKVILDMDNSIYDSKKVMNELDKSIEIALFNLRTYNNVEKEFPEAFKLLPKQSINTSLAINLKDIRCKLDKGNC